MPTQGAQALRKALRQSIDEQAQEDAKLAKDHCPIRQELKPEDKRQCRWPVCRLVCNPLK